MRDTITFDHHAEHAWLHFAIRFGIILLLIFLLLVLTENSLGQPLKQELSQAEVWEAERRLCKLGYWTGPIDGDFDKGSKQALIAFQKIEGRKRTGKLTRDELEAIRLANRPEPLDTTYPHIEIDLKRQVLMFVNEKGQAVSILPVCTGSGERYLDGGKWVRAHTPRGRFIVTRKIKGWRLSRLGLLYYPNYIFNGIAIHGSLVMRTYPDSHGCIRIPMFAAKELGELTPVGTVVVVYDD
jgi:L,D-transpeptidase-like protein/putative peptidoglycan binding protein